LLIGGCERRPDDVQVVVSVIGGPARAADPNRVALSPAGRVLLGATAQGLVAFDAAGGVQPALAQRWIVTDDGQSFIFRLRDDMRWQDGRRVTSEQVAASLSRAIAPGSRNPLLPYLSAIDDIVAMTPEVVEVRLSKPRPNLLTLFAQPELAITRRGGGGSGPFREVEGAPAGAVRLRPATDGQDDAPAPAAEDYVVLRGERAALAVARFAAGRSDLVDGGRADDWPLVAAAGIAPNQLRAGAASGLFGLAVTDRAGFLATPANRAAIAMAIDRAAITEAFRLQWTITEAVLPDRFDSAAPPAPPPWSALALADRVTAARAQVEGWGAPVRLRIALPDGSGGNLLWNALAASLRDIGVEPVRVALDAPADLTLIDAVAPYDSARWYLRTACQPCGATAAALITAARDADDLPTRAARLAEADRALAADVAFIPLARPLRWALVARRLPSWTPNVRAWHPLNQLRRNPN
jgi:peptide/nickel transport system substrate-binding protein